MNDNASDQTKQVPAVSRRNFLKHSSLAAAGTVAVASFPSVLTSYAAPDDPIRVALIGCGGRGSGAGKQAISAAPNVKIIALADIFPDKLEKAKQNFPEVPPENCFSDWDAYKKAIAVPGVNYVILATPPGFRPMQLRAAVEAGKNVFMEKPVGVDGPGIRSVLESYEIAKQKGLNIVAGTQRRHAVNYNETIKRIQDGAIGELMFLRAYWNGGAIWHRPETGETAMEKQLRNWYHYTWICGDHICEQHVHNLNVCNWIMNDHPVKAVGMGGRQALGPDVTGEKWDHFSIEFEYANGVRMYSYCRQISGCDGNVSEAAHGTKGFSNCSNRIMVEDGDSWRWRGQGSNPYVQEHADLVEAIRTGKTLNEAKTVAESTLTAIMGRESAYSGRAVEWDEMLNAKTSLMPEKLAWGPAPEPHVPIPGKHKVV